MIFSTIMDQRLIFPDVKSVLHFLKSEQLSLSSLLKNGIFKFQKPSKERSLDTSQAS